MPSTSRCLHSSEQAARTSQLPPFFPSLPLVHLPSRSTLDRRLKTPRSPGEEASIFASCPRQPRQQKHRHREDATRVENGIARAFGESRRVPPTFRKTRRFFKFTAANQTTPRRPPFQETSRCCFAGHLRSFVLFFVVRHPRALSSGRQPHFVFLSLSRMPSIFSVAHFVRARESLSPEFSKSTPANHPLKRAASSTERSFGLLHHIRKRRIRQLEVCVIQSHSEEPSLSPLSLPPSQWPPGRLAK